jgi:hypothetical protein
MGSRKIRKPWRAPGKIFRMEGSRKFEIRGGGGKIKKRKKKFGPYRRITHTQ